MDCRLLAIGALLLLAACGAEKRSEPSAQPINQAASKIEPEIVVQLGHQSPVAAVRWVNGGKHLMSLAQDGSIVVWDVATKAILDVGQVPGDWTGASDHMPLLQKFEPSADGKRFSLVYFEEPAAEDKSGAVCAPEARRPGNWCTFSLDPVTRAVVPDQRVPLPAETIDPRANERANFPLSPDGKWRPIPNRDDGAPGLFSAVDENIQFDESTCKSRVRCRYGVNLVAVGDNREPVKLTGDPRSYFLDADLSADGRRLVRVEGLYNDTDARVEVLDLTNGSGQQAFLPKSAYHRVRWLGEDNYALFSDGYNIARTDGLTPFPPTLIVDPQCARTGDCRTIDAYGDMEPLADAGAFLGVGSLANCNRVYEKLGCLNDLEDGNSSWRPLASGVSIHPASGGPGESAWRMMNQPDWRGQVITATKLSPDKRQLAVATRVWDDHRKSDAKQTLRVLLFDIDGDTLGATPRELAQIVNPRGVELQFDDLDTISRLDFTSDGAKIVFTQTVFSGRKNATLYVIDAGGGGDTQRVENVSRRMITAGDGRIFGLDNRELIDIGTGKILARLPGGAKLKRAGFIAPSRMIWAANEDGAVEFWDSEKGARLLTLYMFPGNRFFAIAPGGRYDTNLGPDSNLIRWLVPDAPWQSLGPQTFMRDFYEPELYRKLLDCRAADNCGEVFKQLPSIESLNRVTPQVTITGVRQGKNASEAIVTVAVAEGVDARAANGKTRSGIFNPRLFRDGRVVAMTPDEPDAVTDTIERWRKLNNVAPDDKTPGSRTYDFTIPLPTAPGTETQIFSAYAFNEDRIKSDTASFTYTRPAVTPRKPRAFVVTIGINDYDTERFRLNYAVADARLIAERLHDIPGYEMRRLTLAGEPSADGTRRRVDNSTIQRVLSLIMTNDRREDGLARLRTEDGVDASMLEEATPDDIVIVSFSGHGWADKLGNFYLVPTNGYWIEKTGQPELRSLLATADLTMYFRAINAEEITLIIDACHSSASVARAGFKPGPMGDSGLGQLAYDKGIRILAATQADDVAMEDAKLRQGLLSYALAAEGLTATGGKADLDGDRKIRLDEWLGYGVLRLPTLGDDLRLGQVTPGAGGSRAIEFHDLPPNAAKRRIQKPSLFDFNRRASSVILRNQVS